MNNGIQGSVAKGGDPGADYQSRTEAKTLPVQYTTIKYSISTVQYDNSDLEI
jgi:hypothetical protein